MLGSTTIQALRSSQERALVIGGGRFGRLAVARLGGLVEAVVEPTPSPALLALGVEVRRDDGPRAVARALASPHPPGWIVPCLPSHLLVDWLLISLASYGPRLLPVPEPALPRLPMAVPGPAQAWHLSLTDTMCPDNCPEPEGRCLKTGQPRPGDLWRIIHDLQAPGFSVAVLVSHQLAPGVGGLASAEMLALRQRMARAGGRWLVATACRCHGVVQALELARGEGEE